MNRRDQLNRRWKDRRQRVRRDERRGVLLLVVLSMLVLFLLLGTTFLLTSGQYRTAAKIVEKAHRTTFQPADLLERALMQLVRDTNNVNSVVRYHSLLRDLYGVDGFTARVYRASPTLADPNSSGITYQVLPRYAGVDQTSAGRGSTEGQIVEIYVQDVRNNALASGATLADGNAVGLDLDENGLPLEHELSTVGGYYEGCLLTMLSGPCRGQSVRVLGYDPLYRVVNNNSTPTLNDDIITVVARLRVLAPGRIDGKALQAGKIFFDTNGNGVLDPMDQQPSPAQNGLVDFVESISLGSRFILNGRPFNGAGVGYNPLALSSATAEAPLPRLSALELFGYDPGKVYGYGLERALIPNPVHYFEAANVFLDQRAGVDPWAQPYTSQQLRPLTRGFAASGTPEYNPATSPLYKTFAGPGDTDESYDAPDTQNMALAMRALEPRLRGRVVNAAGVSLDPDAYYSTSGGEPAPAYLDLDGVTIPSFHRPELANFWLHRFMNASGFWNPSAPNPTPPPANELNRRVRALLEPYDPATGTPQHGLSANQAEQITLIKRKFLMRPLREDHPDFDGSNALSAYGTTALRNALNSGQLVNGGTGEITFPYWEAVGPWDVDNDGDGVNDSIWVDIGLPVQQTEDGRWYKPLVAMLVEDLDGRLNLNANGSEADMARENYDASQNLVSGGSPGNLAHDYNAAVALITSNQLPSGAGWGVAETSLRPILSPSLPTLAPMLVGNAQYDDYARLLYGRPDPALAGRNTARALRESVDFGRYGSLPGSTTRLPLTKPGRTFITDPALVAGVPVFNTMRDVRTPYEFDGTPRYTGAERTANGYEALSGFSSAPDLGGRYAGGLSGVGASVDEPGSAANVRSFDPTLNRTSLLTWRELVAAAPDDSPYELDLSIGARNQPPAYLDEIRRSYSPIETGPILTSTAPINDDAPFSPAELERILRAFDADAEKLPDRLWKAVDAFDPTKLAAATQINNAVRAGSYDPAVALPSPNSLELVVAGADAAVARQQVTTDSWDLPVPNENLYDRLVLGADGKPGVPEFQSIGTWVNSLTLPADDDGDGLVDEGDEAIAAYNTTGSHTFSTGAVRTYQDLYNAGCDDYVVVMWQDPPAEARLTEYLKYRVALEMLRTGVEPYPTTATLAGFRTRVDLAAERIIFGGEVAATAPTQRGTIGGMLAPELLAGRRMDLNRPFGDGRDNGVRTGNGIVDEPAEAGDAYADLNRDGQYTAGEPWLDLDGNGAQSFHAGAVVNTSLDYIWVDANGDGQEQAAERKPFRHVPLPETFVDRNGVRVYNPQMARQLFARHLYCLMLALQDENYLAPYDSEDPQVLHYLDPLSGSVVGTNGASPESGEAFRIAFDLHAIVFRQEIADDTVTANHTLSLSDPALETRRLLVLNRARQLAQRKLTCRMIAQWAVNVVDFRDPDAIQTPFEYDENPWDGWNVVDTLNGNRVYPLDGDLTTDENLSMHRQVTGGQFTIAIDAPDAEAARRWIPRKDWTRGVVWGAERPEVLLTEGVAWHDRRLEDLTSLTKNDKNNPDDGGKVTGTGGQKDDDLDQLRKPKGFGYIEATNPNLGDDQRPAELYSSVNNTTGAVTRSAGVQLDRLSTQVYTDASGNNLRSPVWRIAVVEEHPLVRNATIAGGAVSNALGQASDDPVTEQVQQYLQQSILWGPWIYGSDADLSTLVPGINVPLLPNAYRQYHTDKKIEVNFALQTQVGLATGRDLTDADGVGVAAGVIERAPTVPDTSFPAFDRFAQPNTPVTKQLSLSSKADAKDAGGKGSGSFVRGMLTKPTTFIERVFYPTPAVNLAPKPSFVGAGTGNYPTANLVDPGLWIPLLAYDVPANYRDGTRLGQEGPHVGVTTAPTTGVVGASATKSVRVFASKFANVYDRFDANQNGDLTETFAIAPLLPGRRAVIGTTGDVYGENTTSVTAQELNDPFAGSIAMRMDRRYAAVISQFPSPTAPGSNGAIPAPNVAAPKAELRRLEMVPSPDPNRHQFAIRMNGLNESESVTLPNGRPTTAFNLTGGEGTGQARADLVSAPPVIAIPIDHFSISEPLDEYLVRQIELDSGLTHYPQPSYVKRSAGQGYPAEEYFATTPTNKAGKHFDEPFDIQPELVENQTTPNYRSVHLERLANPLLPWNPPPVRPDGQVVDQHQPNLPVNPYLPVDARSLDLSAFNSFTDAEKDLAPRGSAPAVGEFVNGATAYPRGPEERHRIKRSLDDLLKAIAARDTVIGFISNERSRPLGPFPLLWMMEPARLLWRQAGPSTFSEIAHQYAAGTNTHNGYLARARDQLAKPPTGGVAAPGERLGLAGTEYDSYQIDSTPYDDQSNTRYKIDQYIDVAWRLTLGFSDWMTGEFHTGSGLQWFSDGATDGPIEAVDLNGDGAAGDLASRPEINGLLPAQSLAPNGMPNAVNNATLNATNAREFLQSYLRTQVAEQATTPEFAWPNRPLASAGELLQVPVWGGSRMLTYYSVFNWQYTQNPHFSRRTQVNPYDGEAVVFHDGLDYLPGQNNPGAAGTFDGDFSNDGPSDTVNDVNGVRRPQAASTNVLRFRDMLGHFGHLMNFFQTARFPSIVGAFARVNADGDPEDFVVPRGASHHYRVLDYVCVPSRFTATDKILNVDTFGAASYGVGDPRVELAMPFNRIDNYREPGRVNLNTIVGRHNPVQPRDHWSEVYDGLMQRLHDDSVVQSNSLIKQSHLGPAWRDVALSRRGYVQSRFNPTLVPTTDNAGLAAVAQNQVDYSPMRMHPDFPTLFANPFRAPGEGANVPLANMVQTGVDATMLRAHPLSPGADGAWGRRGLDNPAFTGGQVNGNRSDASEAGILPIQVGGGSMPLPSQSSIDRLHADTVLARFQNAAGVRGRLPDTFLDDSFKPSPVSINPRDVSPRQSSLTDPIQTLPPGIQSPTNPVSNSEIAKRSTPVALFSGASLEPSLDTERNPTQRYLPIQRMANLATTRSNVYAVWITVGFFEVKQAKNDPRVFGRYMNDTNGDGIGDVFQTPALQELFFRVYPDGWTLGEEIGRATGQDVRHRGFYVIDRSRPVAFKPGEDANVSETVLVRRRIQ